MRWARAPSAATAGGNPAGYSTKCHQSNAEQIFPQLAQWPLSIRAFCWITRNYPQCVRRCSSLLGPTPWMSIVTTITPFWGCKFSRHCLLSPGRPDGPSWEPRTPMHHLGHGWSSAQFILTSVCCHLYLLPGVSQSRCRTWQVKWGLRPWALLSCAWHWIQSFLYYLSLSFKFSTVHLVNENSKNTSLTGTKYWIGAKY